MQIFTTALSSKASNTWIPALLLIAFWLLDSPSKAKLLIQVYYVNNWVPSHHSEVSKISDSEKYLNVWYVALEIPPQGV